MTFPPIVLPALRLFVFVILIYLPASALAQEPETRSYDWLTADQVSGSHVLVINPDGSRTADFEFHDRGRGPKIHEQLATDERGFLTSLQVSGHSYMGATAEETFVIENGEAKWQSTLESGASASGGFYLANDGTPEQLAVLARALLKRRSPVGRWCTYTPSVDLA
jgi:hypothetical protein